jgi:hypothetical protein
MVEGDMPANELVFPRVELSQDTNAVGGLGDSELATGDVGARFTIAPQVLAQQRPNLRWTDPMSRFVLHIT